MARKEIVIDVQDPGMAYFPFAPNASHPAAWSYSLPAFGYRRADNARIDLQGTNGFYWMPTTVGDYDMGACINLSAANVQIGVGVNGDNGYAIRCLQDE